MMQMGVSNLQFSSLQQGDFLKIGNYWRKIIKISSNLRKNTYFVTLKKINGIEITIYTSSDIRSKIKFILKQKTKKNETSRIN